MAVVVHKPIGAHKVTWQARVAIWLWLGWVANYVLFVSSEVVLLALGRWKAALVVAAPWLVLTQWPGIDTHKPAWGHAIGGWIMQRAREFFHLTVILEDNDALKTAMDAGPVVIGLEPHDVLPFSIVAVSKYIGLVPGAAAERLGMMTGILFKLPGMRQMYTWASAASVDKASFVRHLKKGTTCCVIPGGVQEVLALAPGERQKGVVKLYLQRRKGFVKLALAHGAPLVPAFAFGLEGTCDATFPRGPFWEKVARQIGFLPLVYWGSPSWMPYAPPRPAPLTVIFGAPIVVPPPPADRATVDAALVDKYHALFVEGMLALHAKYKAEYGLPGAAISII